MVKINFKYRSSFSPILEDLHRSLNPDDRKRLKKLLKNLKQDDIDEIEYRMHNFIHPYIMASEDERNTNKKWNPSDNPDFRLFLIYFSFLYLQRGYWMIEKINLIPDKNGFLEIIAAYAMIAGEIKTKRFKETIFDEILTFDEFNFKVKRTRSKNN